MARDELWAREIDRKVMELDTRKLVDEVHRAAVERRLAFLEDSLKWIVRIIIGAIITGVVAYAFRGGFFGP